MSKTSYKEKISMKFNISQLERIIVALINNSFNKKFASNVDRLFKLFDPAAYKNEYEKEIRVYIIKQITSIILKNNIDNKDSILSFLDTDGKYYNDSIEILNTLYEEYLPENELLLLDSTISNQLRYSSIMENSENLSDILLNLKTDSFDNLEATISKFEDTLDGINRDIKSARESIEDSKHDMSLSSSGFVNNLGNLINREKNPSTRVKSGIQFLNTMFNGGFERGRLYCALGVAKGWKSGFLLNCASWAKRYNTFTTHDPKAKPVIIYLSMENTNDETLIRLWNHCFGNDSELKNYSAIEAANMLEQAGLFTPNDPNSPELMILYRSNRSISTADLNVILEDLKKEGKECVFLILDYLKRIRPAEANKDLRLELANITNELKTIAMEQDIPVLSAMQLNRNAFAELEAADTFEEKLRASDKLGASNVGESIDIIQNADYSFIVNKMQKVQRNEDGDIEYLDRYLFIKLIACRAKQPFITSFKHRFADNNDMKLIEDINLAKPISTNTDIEFIKDSLSNRQSKVGGGRTIISNK